MAGGSFVSRVISYVANELIVNGLANSFLCCNEHEERCGKVQSQAFQRFAVRTSKQIENVSNIAAQKKKALAEQMEELTKKLEENSKN